MKYTSGKYSKYNQQGLLIEDFNENGELLKSIDYEYDDNGNWITKTTKEYGIFISSIESREIIYN